MTKWIVQTLNSDVDNELNTLPADIQSRFIRVSLLIEQFGPKNVGMPHIRSLGKNFWEIRASGRDGIARGIYIYSSGKRLIVLHVFIKKTQKTPTRALEIAEKRAKKANLL